MFAHFRKNKIVKNRKNSKKNKKIKSLKNKNKILIKMLISGICINDFPILNSEYKFLINLLFLSFYAIQDVKKLLKHYFYNKKNKNTYKNKLTTNMNLLHRLTITFTICFKSIAFTCQKVKNDDC